MRLVSIETPITVDGMAVRGVVHTLSLMLATIAEPFPRIAAQLPGRRLAVDSGAVRRVSAAADVVNRLARGVLE
jgi:hypothetical protein